jgi:hypothetical protein
MGNNDGEEDYEAAAVDERGHSHAHVDGAREDKDDCDRGEIKAKRGCDATQSISSWCDTGGRSREERGVSVSECGRDVRGRHATGAFFVL